MTDQSYEFSLGHGQEAEGSEEEGAVGEAFRARQSDGATGGPREGLNG